MQLLRAFRHTRREQYLVALPPHLLTADEEQDAAAVSRRYCRFLDVWTVALTLGLLEDGMTIHEIRAATEGRPPPAFRRGVHPPRPER